MKEGGISVAPYRWAREGHEGALAVSSPFLCVIYSAAELCVCVPPSPSLRLLPSAMLDDRVPPKPRPFSPPDELFASDLTHP